MSILLLRECHDQTHVQRVAQQSSRKLWSEKFATHSLGCIDITSVRRYKTPPLRGSTHMSLTDAAVRKYLNAKLPASVQNRPPNYSNHTALDRSTRAKIFGAATNLSQ